jgi:glycosyltransferase involved in cell wall biosynthesis
MNKLTIVHFSQDFTCGKPQLGGYGRIFNLINDGNIHIVFTNSKNDDLQEIETQLSDNILIIQLPLTLTKSNIIKRYREVNAVGIFIKNYLRRKKINPDIFFSHSQMPNFFCLQRARNHFDRQIPLLWELNAIWGAVGGGGVKNKISLYVLKYFENKIIKIADGLVFQTNGALNWVKNEYKRSFNSYLVLSNAVNINNSIQNNERTPSPLRRIMVNGLFDTMNGLGTMASYLKNSQILNVEIHFYGDGPWTEEIKSYSNSSTVFFHGAIPRNEIEKKYSEFDFILIPRNAAIEADLFIPSKLLDAMANGVVPIVTNVAGMTEVVSETEGIIINPNSVDEISNAIDIVCNISHEVWRLKSTASIRKVKENYSWTENYKKLNSFYRDVINRKQKIK